MLTLTSLGFASAYHVTTNNPRSNISQTFCTVDGSVGPVGLVILAFQDFEGEADRSSGKCISVE